jgi:phosphoribosyl 1,2-cyclic phosphate phosphodiesterase
MGFDDIRAFNVIQNGVIPAYGDPVTLADVQRIFDYVDAEGKPGVYRPRIEFIEIDGVFDVGPVNVRPLGVDHWMKPTFGYVFTHQDIRMAYVPDCKRMSDELVESLQGVDVMILDGLRHREHRTHLTVAECVEILQRIGAKQSYMIHMTHDLDHEETERDLPGGIKLSYDGLVLEL